MGKLGGGRGLLPTCPAIIRVPLYRDREMGEGEEEEEGEGRWKSMEW